MSSVIKRDENDKSAPGAGRRGACQERPRDPESRVTFAQNVFSQLGVVFSSLAWFLCMRVHGQNTIESQLLPYEAEAHIHS